MRQQQEQLEQQFEYVVTLRKPSHGHELGKNKWRISESVW